MGALVKPPAGPGAFEKRNMVQTHSAVVTPPLAWRPLCSLPKADKIYPELINGCLFSKGWIFYSEDLESEIGMFAFKDPKLF